MHGQNNHYQNYCRIRQVCHFLTIFLRLSLNISCLVFLKYLVADQANL